MTPEQFQIVLEKRLELTKRVLGVKEGEYARNNERLHNFKVVARKQGVLPEEINWTWNWKHLQAIQDMIDDLTKGKRPSLVQWEEKIGDAINYLILLEALVIDRNDAEFDRTIQNQPARINAFLVGDSIRMNSPVRS